MKKSLIALAVLAASGVASAQSTVTIYGLLDTYIGTTKAGGLTQTVVNSGGIQTSRFGFKGTEDLGGGLKANFKLESGFGVDTGVAGAYTNPFTGATSNSTFNRQSWVGLSGGFGEVQIGKMWTPYDDLVGSGIAAFNSNVFAPSSKVFSSSNNYQDRPGNAIYYATPDFGGFTGAAMYSFGENKTAGVAGVKAGKIASFNVAYAGGPVFVGLGYQTEKANGAALTAKFTQVNASYDLGVAKLLAAYGNVKDAAGVPKTTEFQLGADFPVTSAFTISGGYARSKDDNTAPTPDVTRRGFGIMGLYALSKRTNVYVAGNNSKSNAAGNPKTSDFGLGVRHTF